MPPTTRSMKTLSTLASSTSTSTKTRASRSIRKSKRTIEDIDAPDSSSSPQSIKKTRVEQSETLGAEVPQSSEANRPLPATLSFSLEIAKQHLINVDTRFENVFNKLPCRPFEQLEIVDPFRTLVTSILGQQISWLAARTITHRFIRLYYPDLPEKPPAKGSDEPEISKDLFPTPSQVANADITSLKSAGLSTRKAEYVLDLASRFADGRLSSQKLNEADDEELARLLIEVRGIGRWTVDMFAIFSMRRPDILPIGDLGVQRGVARWFLSLHSPSDPITISSKKLPADSDGEVLDNAVTPQDAATLPSAAQQSGPGGSLPSASLASDEPDMSSVPPIPATPVKSKGTGNANNETPASPDKVGLDTGSIAPFPEPFTPSINRTLYAESSGDGGQPNGDGVQKKASTSLPEGLTVASLKSRLNGKKIKGALLTPQEIEDLTEPWRPYRSIGVYYMWALAEDSPAKPSKSSKSSK